MTKQFFADVLRLQIRRVLREQPDLAENVNGLILAVWQESGLRLKRRQPVASYLLPTIEEIMDASVNIINEDATIKSVKNKQHQTIKADIDGMDFEVHPKEPKQKRAKKITVKTGRGNGKSK